MRLSLIFQVLTIILSPLYIIRGGVPVSFLGIFSIPFTLLELMIILTFGITLFEFIKTKSHIREIRTQFDYLILVILGVGLFSVFVSPDILGGLGIYKAYFVEPILFFYCLIFTKRKYQKNYIIPALIIAAFWISLWGLLQKFTGSYSLAFHEIINDRITGPYNSANALALFIGPIIPIILALFFKYKNLGLKVTLLVMMTFFTLIIYWTKSRGGLIAEIGALSVFVTFLVSIRYKFISKLIIILPVLFVIFSFLFFYLMHSLYGERIAESGFRVLNDTLQIRYAIWISTVEILIQNPILGTGLNGFESIYLDYRLHDYPEPFLYPHNFLLTVWTELGLVGLMLFILLLYKIYKLNTLRLLESRSLFAVAYLASFTYIMIHGLVDVPYFKNDLSLMFWILIALTQLDFEHIKERT